MTRRSNRPGRDRAGSKTSGLLVAAMTITFSVGSKPSISTSIWFKVCSRSSFPPPNPVPLTRPTASISSTKIMAGAAFLAILKRSRTREAPTPTNISTNSEPERWKNGTPASPATARAKSVLPVPGAPMRSTPLGIRAPISKNFFGFFRKSTISFNSSLASFTPATSLKVTRWFLSSGSMTLALDWPNEKACMPAPLTCLEISQKMIMKNIIGRANGRTFRSQKPRPLSFFISTATRESFPVGTP